MFIKHKRIMSHNDTQITFSFNNSYSQLLPSDVYEICPSGSGESGEEKYYSED